MSDLTNTSVTVTLAQAILGFELTRQSAEHLVPSGLFTSEFAKALLAAGYQQLGNPLQAAVVLQVLEHADWDQVVAEVERQLSKHQH